MKMNKKALSNVVLTLILILITLTIIGLGGGDKLRSLLGIAEEAKTCQVAGMGQGTCKDTCGPDEFASPLECEDGMKCCVSTGSSEEEQQKEATGRQSLSKCETAGSTSECNLDRTICSNEGRCITLCRYCAENPDADECSGKEVTRQHRCGCTSQEAEVDEYSSVRNLCPSTNPKDENYICCTKQESFTEKIDEGEIDQEAVDRAASLHALAGSLEECHGGDQESCDLAADIIRRELVTDPSWQVIFDNGDSIFSGSSRLALYHGSPDRGNFMRPVIDLPFDICGIGALGAKFRDERHRIYMQDGTLKYSVRFPDQDLGGFEESSRDLCLAG